MKAVPAARAAALAALTVLLLGGCFAMRDRRAIDEPILPGRVAEIRPGVTTRWEVLEAFGPPRAVARPGTTMTFPPPGGWRPGGEAVPSEAFLGLFAVRRPLRPSEVVFYYEASARKETGFLVFPLVGGGAVTKEAVVDRLFLLVNEETGRVEDVILRRAE